MKTWPIGCIFKDPYTAREAAKRQRQSAWLFDVMGVLAGGALVPENSRDMIEHVKTGRKFEPANLAETGEVMYCEVTP